MRALFAATVLNIEKHLPSVLRHVRALEGIFDDVDWVVVDGGSTDGTVASLCEAIGRERVTVLDSRGAESEIKKRGTGLRASAGYKAERLSRARELYLDELRKAAREDREWLVVLDLDEVLEIAPQVSGVWRAVEAARKHGLWGVFPNATPVYYDVWALRAKGWSEDDCWENVWRAGRSDEGLARKHVGSRQVPVPVTQGMIQVESAFGGVGIYRRDAAVQGSYRVEERRGWVECEHVAFHRSVAAATGERCGLGIAPWWTVRAPEDHLGFCAHRPRCGNGARARLRVSGAREVELILPAGHPLPSYLRQHPLYDRRLPLLATLAVAERGGAIVDVGANVGDTAGLCFAAGLDAPIVAIEAAAEYYGCLLANAGVMAGAGADVWPVYGFAGGEKCAGELEVRDGTARVTQGGGGHGIPAYRLEEVIAALGVRHVALLKVDTDGWDAQVLEESLGFVREYAPVIWAEAQTEDEASEEQWRRVVDALQEQYTRMALFDNYGFLVDAGSVQELGRAFMGWLRYCRKRRQSTRWAGGVPIYYVDVALFPKGAEGLWGKFLAALPEAEGFADPSQGG